MFDVRKCDLDKLNSLTKYPSISTYHGLDPKNGCLLENEPTIFDGEVVLTEKVDGTNARIIVLPDGNFVIGSRKELLAAKGDLIGNPALGIVDYLKNIAKAIDHFDDRILVYYGELYGGKVTAHSKQYTSQKTVGFRLFDGCRIENFAELLEQPVASLSSWRENGGQDWLTEMELQDFAQTHGLELTPRLGIIAGNTLPYDLEGMSDFLQGRLAKTQCALDEGAGGNAEGIVLRDKKRLIIAKARFSDYRRSLQKLRR